VSIDPILTRPGVRVALERLPVIAVSPIVGGQAVKGPLARMIPEITGLSPSADAIVRHYAGLLGGIVIQTGDEVSPACAVLSTDTVMRSPADSLRLAEETLRFAEGIAP
jgi:LPPG:FO 2-phospho-L-lactate transferase